MNSEFDLRSWLKKYKWTVLLAVVAFIFAVAVICYGLFKTLFLFACVAAGIFFGLMLDRKLAQKQDGEDSF